ncbi:MAG: hypothetical protein LBL58_08920 [Tannerellaceae bacterium]|jgi:hypothetical protein|nr:hypothetical protein [Tannerellaceae bacterium]
MKNNISIEYIADTLDNDKVSYNVIHSLPRKGYQHIALFTYKSKIQHIVERKTTNIFYKLID